MELKVFLSVGRAITCCLDSTAFSRIRVVRNIERPKELWRSIQQLKYKLLWSQLRYLIPLCCFLLDSGNPNRVIFEWIEFFKMRSHYEI